MRYFLKSLFKIIMRSDAVSHSYTKIESVHDTDIEDTIETWKSEIIPREQWRIVSQQLNGLRRGVETVEFKTFRQALEKRYDALEYFSLLEVGCSSGYYNEVLSRSFPNSNYTGVDFSQEFIKFGKKKFPSVNLRQMDALDLHECQDQEFECVVSGCVLLHIADWKKALIESARVARHTLVLHRTPLNGVKTQSFRKLAYGGKTIEWQFAIRDINDALLLVNFHLKHVITLSKDGDNEVSTLIYERHL